MITWTRLNFNRFAGCWELHAAGFTRAQVAALTEHPAALFHMLDEAQTSLRRNGVTLIVVLAADTEAEAFAAARWVMEDVVDEDEQPLAWKWERAIGDALGTGDEWRRAG